MDLTRYRGSCLCGAISYAITGELSDFGYCHCPSCRKASGSAFGANAGVAREQFEVDDPGEWLREFESSPGKRRAFCGQCGSPLYAYLLASQGLIRIRLGSLDTPFAKTSKAHTFMSVSADWESLDDALPRFDEWADKAVLVQLGSRQTDV